MSSQKVKPDLKYAGLEFGMVLIAMTGLGYWLDKQFATEPILLCILSFIGLIGGTIKLVRLAKQAEQVEQEQKKKQQEHLD